jgi:ABC-2 type transport system permease protein
MLGLLRAEWLKLTKRPLTWVLLAVFLALLLLQLAAQFVFANLGALPGGLGPGAQLEEWRRRTVFPGLFGAILGHVNGLGGVFAVILAAGAMGSEYAWGTLRAQLARRPARGRYLLAKALAVMLLLLAGTLLALATGVACGWALASLTGGAGAPAPADLAALPLAVVRALYVLLPYVLITLCVTVLGRSLLVGLAGGLLLLAFEAAFGALALLQQLGGAWLWLYRLTIQQNINVLALENAHAFGLRPEALAPAVLTDPPPPWQAALVVALYCVAALGVAAAALRRQDITGPG